MVGDTRQGWAVLGGDVRDLRAADGFCRVAGAIGRAGVQRDGRRPGGHRPRSRAATWKARKRASASPTRPSGPRRPPAASNGSVNSMHDSFTPLGGLVPMWLMQLGEVVFGGVGSGLYGMLMFVIVAVFVAGLMVGRTPEYLGKKIEAYEMKMASLVILIPPLVVLVGTAIAVVGPGLDYRRPATEVKSNLNNPGAHGFSEVLYAFSSAGNNNGSAFAGLTANEPFYNIALGHRDVRFALLADDPDAGDRRFAGAQEIHAAGCRHAADAPAAVRRDGREHDPAGRRADVRAGTGLGTDRRATCK